MKRVGAALILAFVSLTTIASSDTLPPASIHLELGKDTLALAEPTMLTIEITNYFNTDLVVDNCAMFSLLRPPFHLSLTLICPNGQEKSYEIDGLVYLAVPSSLFVLSPKESVSMSMIMWWTPIISEQYQKALEQLPSGKYKLFATYVLPDQNKLRDLTVYSDTAEFVFLPFDEDHRDVLIAMDSLWDFFHLKALSKGHASEALPYIRDSQTPYSEAAFAWFIVGNSATAKPGAMFDSLTTGKKLFERVYPNSPFEIFLLDMQIDAAAFDQLPECIDSISRVILKTAPNNFDALQQVGKIRYHQSNKE